MRFSSPKMHQIQNFPGLRPGPRWGSPQRSPRPPSWWEGARCPLPKNPSPALGPSGLERRPFGPRTQHTHILSRGAAYMDTPHQQFLDPPLPTFYVVLPCFYVGRSESAFNRLDALNDSLLHLTDGGFVAISTTSSQDRRRPAN